VVIGDLVGEEDTGALVGDAVGGLVGAFVGLPVIDGLRVG